MRNTDEDEITVAEAARILGVDRSWVNRHSRLGTLPVLRQLPGSGYRRYSRRAIEAIRDAASPQE